MAKRGGKKGRKVRVDMRKNRGKAVRDKTSLTRGLRDDDINHQDTHTSQNVRAKGDLSRKRTVIVRDETADQTDLRSGVVVAMRGLIAEVDDGKQVWACTIRRALRTRRIDGRHPVVVGDAVRFRPVAAADGASTTVSDSRQLPEGVVEEVADRRTMLTRQYGNRTQVVAANVDSAVIVVSADQPTLRPHLIDRYVVAAHQGDMRPVVCINKSDLDSGGFAASVVDRYAAIGYQSLLTSVVDGRGLDALREALQDRTSMLVGPSGVGKSSLLNALDRNLALKVGSLTDLRRGRHTTTTARLLRWAFGGYVVDTPGLRQFDLSAIEPEELEAFFIEFVDRVADCRFQDCSHTHETDCAIQAAVADGRIAPQRHESYCKMYAECLEKRPY